MTWIISVALLCGAVAPMTANVKKGKEEVKEKKGLELKKQHQGMDNLRKYFEENKEIGKYIFFKFRNTLKKS